MRKLWNAKKLLSIALAAVMTMGCLPAQAVRAESGEAGPAKDNVYSVSFSDILDVTVSGGSVNTVSSNDYSWNYAEAAGAEGGSCYDYRDDYAAIRVALGGKNDTITEAGIAYDGPGCK